MQLGDTTRARISAIAEEMRAAGWTENAALLECAATDSARMQVEINDATVELAEGLGAGSVAAAFLKDPEQAWRTFTLSHMARSARATIRGPRAHRQPSMELLSAQAEGIADTNAPVVVYAGGRGCGKSTFAAAKAISLAARRGIAEGQTVVLVPQGQREHFANVLERVARRMRTPMVLNKLAWSAGIDGFTIVIHDDIAAVLSEGRIGDRSGELVVDEAHVFDQFDIDALVRYRRDGQVALAGDAHGLERWRHRHARFIDAGLNPYVPAAGDGAGAGGSALATSRGNSPYAYVDDDSPSEDRHELMRRLRKWAGY